MVEDRARFFDSASSTELGRFSPGISGEVYPKGVPEGETERVYRTEIEQYDGG